MSQRHRPYDAQELEIYARYREQRAQARPAECKSSVPCWVADGPPALTGKYCRGCGAPPKLVVWWRGQQ